MSAGQWTTRRLTPDSTCPLSSGLEAYFIQRLRSSARQYCRGRNYVLLALDVRGLQDFGDISKVGLLVFLEL